MEQVLKEGLFCTFEINITYILIGVNLSKVLTLEPLLKKRLWYRCFLVNFMKFLGTPFFQNTCGGCFCDLQSKSIDLFLYKCNTDLIWVKWRREVKSLHYNIHLPLINLCFPNTPLFSWQIQPLRDKESFIKNYLE